MTAPVSEIVSPDTSGFAVPEPAQIVLRRPVQPAAKFRGVLNMLRKRRSFLAVASERKQAAEAFLLQGRRREESPEGGPRWGFTASKKTGNAVVRNRAKRRLRALVMAHVDDFQPGWDYVLVARPHTTVHADFAEMRRALQKALIRLHAPPRPRKSAPQT